LDLVVVAVNPNRAAVEDAVDAQIVPSKRAIHDRKKPVLSRRNILCL
jgi:hypothetical protein